MLQISRIETFHEINEIPVATLWLVDGDASDGTFPASDSGEFAPGTAITIEVGHGTERAAIFSGLVVRHGIQVLEGGGSRLKVTCADRAMAMTVARRNRQFSDSRDSDVIAKLVGDAGLAADVESTSVTHESLVQYDATDWDYVVTRADVNGLIVTVADGRVAVGKPTFGSPALRVEFGITVERLDGTLDSVSQLPEVTARARDPESRQVRSRASSEPSTNRQGNQTGKSLASVLGVTSYELQTLGTASDEELSAWADASLVKSRLARIRGKVTFPGSALAVPATTLELAGVGDRFTGHAFVSGVRHVIAGGEWRTEAGFGLSERWFAEQRPRIQAPPASGLRPAAGGLRIARVEQVDEDPEGRHRIRVTWPLMGDGGAGVWVRMATPYASENVGLVFRPEAGDEVVLGFLGDDPTDAIVLGALHSGPRPAPWAADDRNGLKGVVTRSGLKMTFDDSDQVTVISTPGGRVVTLSDKDEKVTIVDSNANRIELNGSGIVLSSPGDISISADGKVSISGQKGVDISPPVVPENLLRRLMKKLLRRSGRR
jgi:Rhs element Vgr protein